MVLPTSKKNVGLGKAMIRSRFRGGTRPKDHDTDLVHTTDMDDGPSWTKLQSITQEGDLDSFLRIAELADTDFTAHRQNVTVVSAEDNNPFLMSKDEESRVQKLHKTFQNEVVIPRRPHWEKTMTAREVQRNEQTSFLDWRRSLALLQEANGLLLTPYERNLEVWRQLWRVVERSQLVVQIVDARNPMTFRSEDLEKYVSEVHGGSVDCLLLVNKADLLTDNQRTQWADYFDKNNIKYKFFSAKISNVELERELEREMAELKLAEQKAKEESEDDDDEEEGEESDNEEESKPESAEPVLPQNNDDEFYPSAFGKSPSKDPRIQILSCSELLDLFHATAQPSTNPEIPEQYRNKITIGLVGYPNVGKSSTINALIGTKKVAVASTPGKTKHFQTLHLDDKTILCDCPGLVFPSFATTQANMVCDGVLPIDTLREYTGPIGLVVRRVPKWYLEALYGIHISMPTVEQGGDGTNIPQPEDFLKSYAMARGFTRAGQGNPDEARGARYILKDYINAKLLYNHPPPDCKDVEAFNKEIYCVENLPKKKLFTAAEPTKQKKILGTNTNLLTSKALDSQFFTSQKSLSAHAISKGKYQTDKFGRSTVYPHQRMVNSDGTISLQSSGPQSEFMVKDKKHRKGKKNGKVRNRMGYDV